MLVKLNLLLQGYNFDLIYIIFLIENVQFILYNYKYIILYHNLEQSSESLIPILYRDYERKYRKSSQTNSRRHGKLNKRLTEEFRRK